ncbi:hypothetical protein NLX69_01370 [Rossellomorea sp. BNER]|nr:hypothetical protein [Rossellomorea sp. BNER]
MKDLEEEYPILKEDKYHRKVKKRNKYFLLDFLGAIFRFIFGLLFR